MTAMAVLSIMSGISGVAIAQCPDGTSCPICCCDWDGNGQCVPIASLTGRKLGEWSMKDIKGLQQHLGLEPTGTLDIPTKNRLKEKTGLSIIDKNTLGSVLFERWNSKSKVK